MSSSSGLPSNPARRCACASAILAASDSGPPPSARSGRSSRSLTSSFSVNVFVAACASSRLTSSRCSVDTARTRWASARSSRVSRRAVWRRRRSRARMRRRPPRWSPAPRRGRSFRPRTPPAPTGRPARSTSSPGRLQRRGTDTGCPSTRRGSMPRRQDRRPTRPVRRSPGRGTRDPGVRSARPSGPRVPRFEGRGPSRQLTGGLALVTTLRQLVVIQVVEPGLIDRDGEILRHRDELPVHLLELHDEALPARGGSGEDRSRLRHRSLHQISDLVPGHLRVCLRVDRDPVGLLPSILELSGRLRSRLFDGPCGFLIGLLDQRGESPRQRFVRIVGRCRCGGCLLARAKGRSSSAIAATRSAIETR